MGKRFMKFRVSRVIPTFHCCRSKDPSTLPSNPVPSFLRLSPAPHLHPSPLIINPHRSSLNRHVSSSHPSPEDSRTQSFKWGEDPNWHVIPKLPDYHKYHSTPDTDKQNDVVFLPPPPPKALTRRIRRRRRTFQKVRISTSSDSGLFSEDDDDQERETLVSSDSPSPRFRRLSIKSKHLSTPPEVSPVPARLSEFMRRMTPCRAVADGKVRESFAVVKRSEDPYEDFKRSMVEMVVEKQMFEERELQELLQCFLSLNSERYHGVIVRAFAEIWEGLCCPTPLPE